MRHNKKRNTALLYEFLIRHVSKCLIESRKDEANKAVALLKKYYKSGPLYEEMRLFNHAFNSGFKTSEYAAKGLSEILRQATKINPRRLDENKSKLIKEINRTFKNENLFAHKIPHYVMYASLQTLLNNATGHKRINESVDGLELQEKVVTFMATDRKRRLTLSDSLKLDPTYNNAVYRMVINKFNEKYAGSLSESQRVLLTKYAVSMISNNKHILQKTIKDELATVKTALEHIHDKDIVKDKDLLTKISQCRQRLDEVRTDSIDEPLIVSVLQFMSLANEVKQE